MCHLHSPRSQLPFLSVCPFPGEGESSPGPEELAPKNEVWFRAQPWLDPWFLAREAVTRDPEDG